MNKEQAQNLVRETFEKPFDKGQYIYFIKNLFNKIEEDTFEYWGAYIKDAYKPYIKKYERIGKYQDDEGNKTDILSVNLKKETSLERARTMQRNFIAQYLKDRGEKDSAIVAFYTDDLDDWRFSLVKMEYKLAQTESGKIKAKEELTPARRYSFLVGKNEPNHTAQQQLIPLLQDDINNPTLSQLESTFNIEKVTKEFFEKYRTLFIQLKEVVDEIVRKDKNVGDEFINKNIDTVDFSKKLLGQIVFLYFLQKKGWLGVPPDKPWGEGDRGFLRTLFIRSQDENKNFFNDFLEVLFYNTLNNPRQDEVDPSYSRFFDCRIPFLNGGLFEPIQDYDWKNTDIKIPNNLFSNDEKTKEGDMGNGILDVFDRYNFTVKEDEPLDKEVAIDPEMLGKVFENLLEIKDRKSKGSYYTPREIVHYMCQESLINYLATELINCHSHSLSCHSRESGNPVISKEDIETLIRYGEFAIEYDTAKEEGTKSYKHKLPESIRDNAKLIDEKLGNIRICDPAVGSGAFLVGMMTEIVKARNVINVYICHSRESGNPESKSRTIYNFKRDAIQNCLYGVDIDPSAVDIAKLRLWLSLVVDEEDIKQIKPLPNLDYKIICGNSLLGVEKDLFNEKLFAELERLKPIYFNETDSHKKQEYKKEIDKLITEITNNDENFDFEVYFSEVFHEKKTEKDWKAYHVTWVTHNSRVSERMVEFGVKTGEPILLTDEMRNFVSDALNEKIMQQRYRVLACNVLADHVHCVVVCEESEITEMVRQLKGYSSFILGRQLKLSVEGEGRQSRIWADGYSHTFLQTEEHLRNAIEYIENNHSKHNIPPLNRGLQPSAKTPIDYAFYPLIQQGGFDVVIANPPYVDSETMTKTNDGLRNIYTSIFKSAKGNWDLFIVFIEKGLGILKINGIITYIVPNKLIAATYSEELREIIIKKNVKEIRDFSSVKVFRDVNVYPVVFLIQNNNDKSPVVMTLMESVNNITYKNKIPAEIFYQDIYWDRYFTKKEILDIVIKMSKFKPLSFYCPDVSSSATVSEAYELKKYIKDGDLKTTKNFKKLINTGTIDRYLSLWGRQRTQYIKDWYIKPTILDECIKKINPNRYSQSKSAKIIIGGMAKELECFYDEGEYLAGKSTTIILDNEKNKINLKFLLSLLNSKLISFWYISYYKSLALSGGYLRINNTEVKNIPIPEVTPATDGLSRLLIGLVNQILAITKDDDYLKNPGKQSKVKEYKHQIDQMVYELYDLTDEEIKIVEGI